MFRANQVRHPLDAAVMPEVPRQRGAAPAPRAGLQPRRLPRKCRTAGADGRVVADQLAAQAHQDWRAGRPACTRHHVSARRGCRVRADGPCRHSCDPASTGAPGCDIKTAPPLKPEETRLGQCCPRHAIHGHLEPHDRRPGPQSRLSLDPMGLRRPPSAQKPCRGALPTAS